MLEFARLHPFIVGITCLEGIFPHAVLFVAFVWHIAHSKGRKSESN